MAEPSTPPTTSVPSTPAAGREASSSRLTSLDAFRGAIMLLMASSGLGLPQMAKADPENGLLAFLARQCEHAEWAGCTLWDLIQPAFMFMVGVAVPWSIANRQARGDRAGAQIRHAGVRAMVLVLLAVFLTSAWSPRTEWVFTNVLAQIGLGYPFLFLVALARPRTAWIAAGVLLMGYWIVFAAYPLPPPDFDWAGVGVPASWPHLAGFAAHWEKNANAAAAFDVWFLNLFPRDKPFVFSSGGYQTLNFVPSLATMIFGLVAGRWLRSERTLGAKVRLLVGAGIAGLALGWMLGASGVCPIVKRIWTPSWTLFSTGWVCLLLAGFFVGIETVGWRRWAYPLVVAGMNPITLYCLWQLTGGFVRDNLRRHFGTGIFESLGPFYAPMLERLGVLFVFWLILAWMARHRFFVRI